LDEISSKEARRYFKKFVKRWNDYELDGMAVTICNDSEMTMSNILGYRKIIQRLEFSTIGIIGYNSL